MYEVYEPGRGVQDDVSPPRVRLSVVENETVGARAREPFTERAAATIPAHQERQNQALLPGLPLSAVEVRRVVDVQQLDLRRDQARLLPDPHLSGE